MNYIVPFCHYIRNTENTFMTGVRSVPSMALLQIVSGEADAQDLDLIIQVLKLTQEYGISARLTFSNSLLRKEHLTDKKCNILCKMFEEVGEKRNGVIVHSDLLLKYLEINYPKLYFVSSTTKVLTDFNEFLQEIIKI